MIFGVMVGGMVKVFLNPGTVARHLGRGRVMPVVKAALMGIPLPLCSCGVAPAAASLKQQGATTGATTSFLIATPESGVDSIAVTYALMDPVMTVARPAAAFATAAAAGLANSFGGGKAPARVEHLPVLEGAQCGLHDGGCGCGAPDETAPAGFAARLLDGQRYAFGELWGDLAGWFWVGIILAGAITALMPETLLSGYLGGGISGMLLMLVIGIPLYICSSASTPIAAALILKGVSPGAALVFLLAGPATNMASLTMVTGFLGKRATAIYLASIALMSVLCGLALDAAYPALGIEPRAVIGQAGELMPMWLRWLGAAALAAISVGPLWRMLRGWVMGHFSADARAPHCHERDEGHTARHAGCGRHG